MVEIYHLPGGRVNNSDGRLGAAAARETGQQATG